MIHGAANEGFFNFPRQAATPFFTNLPGNFAVGNPGYFLTGRVSWEIKMAAFKTWWGTTSTFDQCWPDLKRKFFKIPSELLLIKEVRSLIALVYIFMFRTSIFHYMHVECLHVLGSFNRLKLVLVKSFLSLMALGGCSCLQATFGKLNSLQWSPGLHNKAS